MDKEKRRYREREKDTWIDRQLLNRYMDKEINGERVRERERERRYIDRQRERERKREEREDREDRDRWQGKTEKDGKKRNMNKKSSIYK